MPEVSFYILPSQTEQGRLFFACKLAEKAYRSGSHVFIHSQSAKQSQQLDDLLWTFRAGSFLPHQIYTDSTPDIANRILIGLGSPPEYWQNMIINLADQCPEFTTQTERILEILDSEQTVKQAGRQRYRHYQKTGCRMNTHKM